MNVSTIQYINVNCEQYPGAVPPYLNSLCYTIIAVLFRITFWYDIVRKFWYKRDVITGILILILRHYLGNKIRKGRPV